VRDYAEMKSLASDLKELAKKYRVVVWTTQQLPPVGRTISHRPHTDIVIIDRVDLLR